MQFSTYFSISTICQQLLEITLASFWSLYDVRDWHKWVIMLFSEEKGDVEDRVVYFGS